MQELVITLATPVFFLLIFIEWIAGRLRDNDTYRLNDSINSIGLGIISQIVGVFSKVFQIGIYAWVAQRAAVFTLAADNPLVWLLALLAYDFCYYWLHRMGHEVNILWAAHVVHHQSEEYNLSTALRQTGSGFLFGWVFYLPLALAGVPTNVFIAVALVDLLYQFWVHTRQIGRLGWFDRFFVSPSNHRAHHGVNDIYLDKNYGGILILWDRLFGTYVEEDDAEPVVYGTRSPLRSWNPIRANLEVYAGLWHDAMRARKLSDKLRVWFARPGWRPADVAASHPSAPFDLAREIFNPRVGNTVQWYCLAQFSTVLLITTHFLAVGPLLSLPLGGGYGLWLLLSLWIVGGLLEGARRYPAAEAARLLITGIGVAVAGQWWGYELTMPALALILGACAASLGWLMFLFRSSAKQQPDVSGHAIS
ncbi:MAG TPA: sterol desaturase family protein [Burkholderiaceae bacterium]